MSLETRNSRARKTNRDGSETVRRTRRSERRIETYRRQLEEEYFDSEQDGIEWEPVQKTGSREVDKSAVRASGRMGSGKKTVESKRYRETTAADQRRRAGDTNPQDKYAPTTRRKGKKRRKKHGVVKRLLLLCLIFVIGFSAYSFIKPYFGEKYWTVAVFGLDSRDGNLGKGALSDVIMVASINRRDGSVKLSSIYRDTYTQVDSEGKYHKLNEAYFLGGHEQAVEALERNFDLQIDDYVSFNWAAVAKAITALGGVDLEITDSEFKYINAFITETVNSTGLGSVQLEHAGMNHLDGVQAVAYGRLRLMDTDFNRTARQRKVLSLTVEKAKQANAKTLADVARYVFPEVSTSMGIDDIVNLARNVKKYDITDSQGFPFARTTKKISKMDCVIPGTLQSNVVQLHNYLYGIEDFQVSSTVRNISEHIQEVSGVGVLENSEPVVLSGGSSSGSSSGDSETKATENSGENKSASSETQSQVVEGSAQIPEESSETVVESLEETEEQESTVEDSESIEENTESEIKESQIETSKEESSAPEESREETASSQERPTAPGGSVPAPGEEDSGHGPGISGNF